MHTITVANKKGGAGKSTISSNLAGALADLGLSVLYIDTDPQGTSSKLLGNPEHQLGLVEFIVDKNELAISKTEMSESLAGTVDLILNNDPNNELKNFFGETTSHIFHLAHAVKKIQNNYDVIVIDTKGDDGRGEVKEAAILAGDIILTPTRPAGLDLSEVQHNIDIFDKITTPFKAMSLTRNEPVLKILINAYERTNLSKDVSQYLRQNYKDSSALVSVLATEIPLLDVYKTYFTDNDFAHRLSARPLKGKNPSPCGAESMLSLIHELFPNYIDLTFKGLNNG